MANRTTYSDFGLVFAREAEHLQTPKTALGQPLKALSEAPFRQLVKDRTSRNPSVRTS